jgi:hypothetical protein
MSGWVLAVPLVLSLAASFWLWRPPWRSQRPAAPTRRLRVIHVLIGVCALGSALLFFMRNHPAVATHSETREIFMGMVLSLVGLLYALVPPQWED